MNRLITGLLLFVVGLWATYAWWWFIADIVKGLFALGLLVIGLILIGLGVRNLSTSEPVEGTLNSEMDLAKPLQMVNREKKHA